eukprot:TRINITY_DN6871_c0_g1_i1.p1 TRINITY_DN6871_c0_g1~~TRINITY_DN6871_c0_g1_i1.p1  ORF type:complete len:703 (-),score=120.70 TRINITY_DN6871_c0_g1_i1:133-2241(-)
MPPAELLARLDAKPSSASVAESAASQSKAKKDATLPQHTTNTNNNNKGSSPATSATKRQQSQSSSSRGVVEFDSIASSKDDGAEGGSSRSCPSSPSDTRNTSSNQLPPTPHHPYSFQCTFETMEGCYYRTQRDVNPLDYHRDVIDVTFNKLMMRWHRSVLNVTAGGDVKRSNLGDVESSRTDRKKSWLRRWFTKKTSSSSKKRDAKKAAKKKNQLSKKKAQQDKKNIKKSSSVPPTSAGARRSTTAITTSASNYGSQSRSDDDDDDGNISPTDDVEMIPVAGGEEGEERGTPDASSSSSANADEDDDDETNWSDYKDDDEDVDSSSISSSVFSSSGGSEGSRNSIVLQHGDEDGEGGRIQQQMRMWQRGARLLLRGETAEGSPRRRPTSYPHRHHGNRSNTTTPHHRSRQLSFSHEDDSVSRAKNNNNKHSKSEKGAMVDESSSVPIEDMYGVVLDATSESMLRFRYYWDGCGAIPAPRWWSEELLKCKGCVEDVIDDDTSTTSSYQDQLEFHNRRKQALMNDYALLEQQFPNLLQAMEVLPKMGMDLFVDSDEMTFGSWVEYGRSVVTRHFFPPTFDPTKDLSAVVYPSSLYLDKSLLSTSIDTGNSATSHHHRRQSSSAPTARSGGGSSARRRAAAAASAAAGMDLDDDEEMQAHRPHHHISEPATPATAKQERHNKRLYKAIRKPVSYTHLTLPTKRIV